MQDDSLYVFPTAKSMEVLFVNTTIFNRFARETGASMDDLHTFEGIARTAALYYDWTDQQTPEVAGDGKAFFLPDSLFNYSLMGVIQLGSEFIRDDRIDTATPEFRKVWDYIINWPYWDRRPIFDGLCHQISQRQAISYVPLVHSRSILLFTYR